MILAYRHSVAMLAIFGAASTLGVDVAAQSAPSSESASRTEWGTPQLGGWWIEGDSSADGTATNTPVLLARDGDLANFEQDFAVLERRNDNLPLYKPEYWDEIRHNDFYGLTEDPVFNCRPSGLPRMGPPAKIVHTEDELIFLYPGSAHEAFRIIPVDGREFDPLQMADWTSAGHSIGHWEGDTLVIESVGFSDESWLGWAGWTHSAEMTVVERVWREGNELHWQATVHDPVMLQAPWTMEEQVQYLNTEEHVWVFPALPCEEKDAENMVERTRG